MKNTVWITLAITVLPAMPALSQSMGTPPHALGSPSPAPMAMPHQTQSKLHMPHGMGDNPAGRRATDALNLLEAKGYPDFAEFGPEGANFSASVLDGNGNRVKIAINPDTGEIKGP
ncbi:MAG: hypothetical protein ACLPL5_01430 [Stellaceae bacterium]|jgi:hypothetical protein